MQFHKEEAELQCPTGAIYSHQPNAVNYDKAELPLLNDTVGVHLDMLKTKGNMPSKMYGRIFNP